MLNILNDNPEAYEQWIMEMEQNHQFHQQLAEDAAVSGVASQQKPVEELLHRYKDFFERILKLFVLYILHFIIATCILQFII